MRPHDCPKGSLVTYHGPWVDRRGKVYEVLNPCSGPAGDFEMASVQEVGTREKPIGLPRKDLKLEGAASS